MKIMVYLNIVIYVNFVAKGRREEAEAGEEWGRVFINIKIVLLK